MCLLANSLEPFVRCCCITIAIVCCTYFNYVLPLATQFDPVTITHSYLPLLCTISVDSAAFNAAALLYDHLRELRSRVQNLISKMERIECSRVDLSLDVVGGASHCHAGEQVVQ